MSIIEKIEETVLCAFYIERQRSKTYDLSFEDADITHVGVEIKAGEKIGGTCWGGVASYRATGERICEDDIILGLSQLGLIDIDVMTVRELMKLRKHFKVFTRSQNEYYGNSSNFECLAIRVMIEDGKLALAGE